MQQEVDADVGVRTVRCGEGGIRLFRRVEPAAQACDLCGQDALPVVVVEPGTRCDIHGDGPVDGLGGNAGIVVAEAQDDDVSGRIGMRIEACGKALHRAGCAGAGIQSLRPDRLDHRLCQWPAAQDADLVPDSLIWRSRSRQHQQLGIRGEPGCHQEFGDTGCQQDHGNRDQDAPAIPEHAIQHACEPAGRRAGGLEFQSRLVAPSCYLRACVMRVSALDRSIHSCLPRAALVAHPGVRYRLPGSAARGHARRDGIAIASRCRLPAISGMTGAGTEDG